jgi:opacity protein-like surface antigen
MKRIVFVMALVAVCGLPAVAQAQSRNSSVQGFGGVTFGSSEFAGLSAASSFGAGISTGLTPNIQIIGEGGRLSDLDSPVLDLLDLTPVNLSVSAWYAQGGVRFIASPHLAVRPYSEATAGVARLHTGLSGLSGVSAAIVDRALGFLNRTEPMLGLGAGVVFGAGPVAIDVGYRYKRIMASGIQSALNAGNAYQVNEARVGVGVRF